MSSGKPFKSYSVIPNNKTHFSSHVLYRITREPRMNRTVSVKSALYYHIDSRKAHQQHFLFNPATFVVMRSDEEKWFTLNHRNSNPQPEKCQPCTRPTTQSSTHCYMLKPEGFLTWIPACLVNTCNVLWRSEMKARTELHLMDHSEILFPSGEATAVHVNGPYQREG